MKQQPTKSGYPLQKYWFLGFLGLTGIYEWPEIWACWQGEGSLWNLTKLLWFLWFTYFLPEQ